MPPPRPPSVFLISPATTHGPRALALRRPGSSVALARRLRAEGVPLGDVFTFLSGLYFRGKLEYARAFTKPEKGGGGVHVITMTDGLVSPDTRISADDLERYAQCMPGDAAAGVALETTALEIARGLSANTEVILLGSVSTGKYTDILAPIFGERLRFPRDVLHLGQLARGALFLRRAREGPELDYAPVSEIIRAGRRVSIKSDPTPPTMGHGSTETRSPATRPNTADATADSRQ